MLRPYAWLGLFLFKALLSVVYIYLQIHFIDGGDVFTYLRDAATLREWASNDFSGFLRLCFGPSGTELPENLQPAVIAMGYWGDKSAYLMVRIHTVLWFLSNGFIYTHGLFFAGISCLGIHFIMKAWRAAGHNVSAFAYMALICFPSFAFWTSGIHKEAIWLLGAGMLLWAWIELIKNRLSFHLIPIILLGSWTLFLLRDFSLYIILLGLLAYSISFKARGRSGYLHMAVFYGLIAFTVLFVPDWIGYPGITEVIQQKQAAFESLKIGDTHIDIPRIEGRWDIFTKLPAAFAKATISPIKPIDGVPFSYLLIFDNLLLLISFFTLFIHVLQKRLPNSFALSCLISGLLLLLICGFIVPNLGAMSRYRTMALALLLPALFSQSQFSLRFFNYIFKN